MHNCDDAIVYFSASLSFKSDEIKTYLALSQVYKKKGDKKMEEKMLKDASTMLKNKNKDDKMIDVL